MKAMLLRTPRPVTRHPLAFDEVIDPSPDAEEILVRVSVCGVCRTDLHLVEGELPVRKSPVIPGHQVVGTVVARGDHATRFKLGERVGVAWLYDTCGSCAFCIRDRENLCNAARFTGFSVDGGYAEYTTIPEAFAYRIPGGFEDGRAAPLLCAGIIGYRALRASGVESGQRLGLYGFGASAHLACQVALHQGCEVFVLTRSESNRRLARRLGAVWVGGSQDTPPAKLHGAIIFAPAGPLVLSALEVLEKGGTVVLSGIYMSPVPRLDYVRHLYDEKVVRSVANATRRDGQEFLDLAARIPIRTTTTTFPLEQANEALLAVKTGRVTGAVVLRVSS